MSLDTSNANAAFLPDQIGALIERPVGAQSVAMQVSTMLSVANVNGYRIPIVSADPTAAWTAEGGTISATDSTLAELYSKFFKLAGLTVISRELANDSSPEAAQIVGRGLARDLATKVDAAFFGTNGVDTARPEGLEDLSGVSAVAAGELWSNVDPFSEAVYGAEAVGATVTAFVANPADALALAKVKKASGSNEPLLGNDPTMPTRRTISGVPLYISPGVALGRVWGISKEFALTPVREGTTLDVDSSAYFNTDQVGIRAIMRLAFMFPHAASIQAITLDRLAPQITAITPATGTDAGGTSVTITGTHLTGTSAVTFDAVAGTAVSVVSSGEVTVTAPAGTAGAVDVIVTNAYGATTVTDGFTFEA